MREASRFKSSPASREAAKRAQDTAHGQSASMICVISPILLCLSVAHAKGTLHFAYKPARLVIYKCGQIL